MGIGNGALRIEKCGLGSADKEDKLGNKGINQEFLQCPMPNTSTPFPTGRYTNDYATSAYLGFSTRRSCVRSAQVAQYKSGQAQYKCPVNYAHS
ncbi:MAG: hypothetical protein V7K54_29330 [Nostoc sp.]